ncbi:MAG: hypothetical protein IJ867_01055 [Clostridia bacterium]|nr:hypothetical protein [Clostridia bacterium]
MTFSGNSYNRAGGYNQKTKNRSHAIYEICTQATAAKMARNRGWNDFKNGEILTGDGYSDEIFAVPLIASTFGVSEQEVLKYGLRERSKLVAVLNKHIGDLNYTEEMLNKIEDELEIIHSIGYPDENQKKYKNMSENTKKKKRTDSILKLTKDCQKVFAQRIVNTPLDVTRETVTAYKLDQKKMMDTLRNEFSYYHNELNKEYGQLFSLAIETGEDAEYITKSLNVLSDLAKKQYGGLAPYKAEIVDCIRRKDFVTLAKYGFQDEREVTMYFAYNDTGMIEKRLHQDYNSLIAWDNRDIVSAICYRDSITEEIPTVLYLKNWDERRLNSPEGMRKLQALQNAAKMTYDTGRGKDIRYTLFQYLQAKPDEVYDVYVNIANICGAREGFIREFSGSYIDKEFLVKLMAKKYMESVYDFEKGQIKQGTVKTKNEEEIKRNLLPTIEKFGKDGAMWAITKTVLEGKYDSISNGEIGARKNLRLVSPNSFLDVISAPLMNELTQKREIPEDLKDAVGYSMLRTDEKYTGTVPLRIMSLIREFNQLGRLNHHHFTGDGREGLSQTIQNKADLENMIGYICNNFSAQARAERNPREGSHNYQYYKNLAIQMGENSFREAMIQAIVNNDLSGFPPEYANVLSTMNFLGALEVMTPATIEKADKIRRFSGNVRNVSVAELRENARKQKLPLIDKVLSKLKNIFGKEDREER